jgi:hypothetical protein
LSSVAAFIGLNRSESRRPRPAGHKEFHGHNCD